MAPIVDGLTVEFAEQVRVVRVDAAAPENQSLVERFGVRGHPALFIVDAQARIVQQFYGTPTADMLRDAIRQALP